MNRIEQIGFRGCNLARAATAMVRLITSHGGAEPRSGVPAWQISVTPWLRASPPSLGQFAWTYHADTSLKAALAYPNGLVASWAYDAENRLAQVRNAMPSGVISQFDYTYDAAGRRVAIARSGTAFGDLSGAADRYAYNARGEVTGARRTKDGQPVQGFSEDFAYDPIGNRTSSATYDETGEAQVSTYAANALNQYVSRTTPGFAAVRGEADPDATVTVNGRPAYRLGAYFFGGDVFDNSASGGFANLEMYAALGQTDADGNDADDLVSSVTGQVYVAQSPEAFAYDADGNQTLVTTRTGRWRVEYNGENRPVRWMREGDGKTVTMSYDHIGRRRTKDGQRFFYDGYLQVANERTVSNAVVRQSFVWDPTEPVATRPLAWFGSNAPPRFYAHDGNKNVSEVVAAASGEDSDVELLAHYDCAEANPWRFSSEYEDTDLGLVYYNYRHYEPVTGRWLSFDIIDELLLYLFCFNNPIVAVDIVGLQVSIQEDPGQITVSMKRGIRGKTVHQVSIQIECSSAGFMSISGSAYRKIVMLNDGNEKWKRRYRRYDRKWGTDRSDSDERNATYSHEMDHYRSYDALFAFIHTLNGLDGSYFGMCFCPKEKERLEAQLSALKDMAERMSRSYDLNGRNEGGVYPL